MPPSSDSSDVPTGPVQLNGWKEIAAYLGRSVRTVQRWEKDFGLPVRRFGVSKPESVFALPRDVDAWRETSRGISARSGAGAPDPAGQPAKPAASATGHRQGPFFGRTSLGRMALAVIAAAIVMTSLWALWLYRDQRGEAARDRVAPAAAAEPADWRVDFNTLVVSDSRGQVLWTHPFENDLDSGFYRDSKTTPRSVLGGVADVDGDGLREVWFVARASGGPANTAMYLFEHDGRVRWTYRPTFKVRFGTVTFGPSWIVDRAFVTENPGRGPGRALWGVLYDSALFPSSIQRLDPKSGLPQSEYWTNGSIVTAALDQSTTPPRLLVGACYNETRAGSLSVLDALNPNGSAPAATGKYRCTSCPPGEPRAFLVFPKPARFGKTDATGPLDVLTPMTDGTLGVRVQYATSGPETSAVGVFTLDPSLTPVAADTADGYLATYEELVRRGAAPAGAPATVDPEREFFPILRWDPAARRFTKVFLRR